MKKYFKIIMCSLLVVGLYYGLRECYTYYVRSTYLPVRYPIICANGFRHASDHFFDQPNRIWISLTGKTFDPSAVQDGDIIFIKNDSYYLNKFFTNVHPRIKARYSLLSHNGDQTMPGAFAHYLDDDKLIAWCGCNFGSFQHPKIVRIPIGVIGILNGNSPANCEELWGKITIDLARGKIKKTNLCYISLNTVTNPKERGAALQALTHNGFHSKPANKPYAQYLGEMATFKFVISPHGRGLDCYRTWEALMLGCFPVVKKSCLDVLYQDLPVVIVDDWNQVTQAFLEQKYHEMSQRTYNRAKLSIDYWINLIKQKTTIPYPKSIN
jgi:hypothetical protein